jgi:hypothetical protein
MRGREQQLIVGRLIEHDRAHYQFRRNEDVSYFVKLLTQKGERIVWGKDLERAIHSASTKPKPGDMVGARRVGRDAVTVMHRERDAQGHTVRESAHIAHRQRWVVEKVTFFAERARLARRLRDAQHEASSAVKEHPELASTYLTLRGAEKVAEQRIADPKDRARFVALVREAIASSIKKGEPLPTVRVREGSTPAPDSPAKRKDEPTR